MATAIRPQLTHVGLHTHAMDEQVAFFTEIFGLTVTDQGTFGPENGRIVFMSATPDEHHQVVLLEGGPDKDTPRTAQQISFLVGSLDELREMHKRVTDAGFEVDRMVTHGNAWSCYFFGPEGNRLELYAHTPWHIPQPHAHPFDLSKPTEEIVAETEAHVREYDGFMPAEERRAKMADVIG
jgi:catechol 2,3-dioxygenase